MTAYHYIQGLSKKIVLPIPVRLLVSGSAEEGVGISGIKKMEKCEDEMRVLQVEQKKVA